jgi:peptide-methionine (S)-S-oxide reductase
MPKMYDHEPTRATCSECCMRKRLTGLERGMRPVANPHSHKWIRINHTLSARYEQFPAKPLKINAGSFHIMPPYPSALPRIRCGQRLRTPNMPKLSRLFPFVLAFGTIISLVAWTTHAAPPSAPIPAAKVDSPLAAAPGKQTAVFAGGCFWGTQSVFERVKGVVKTTAGYSGGAAKTATYDQVSSETTGHAESVEVVYDPSKITYGQLLRIFFSVVHDPTQLNRQGPDVGTSYRSAIFYTNDEQKRIATAYIAQLDAAKVFPKAIVTEVTPLKGFYRAEDYHQDYALHHEDNPYIQVCDVPKIKALKQQFPELFVEYQGK